MKLFCGLQHLYGTLSQGLNYYRLLQCYTIFQAANWNNNTTSSFPPGKLWTFSPAEILNRLKVNYSLGFYHLPKFFLLRSEKLSKLIEAITAIMVMVCRYHGYGSIIFKCIQKSLESVGSLNVSIWNNSKVRFVIDMVALPSYT